MVSLGDFPIFDLSRGKTRRCKVLRMRTMPNRPELEPAGQPGSAPVPRGPLVLVSREGMDARKHLRHQSFFLVLK
jgi:hypothetical protein